MSNSFLRATMRIPKRPVRTYTAKLPKREHDMLRDLRKTMGTEDRYTALLQLVPIVESLTEKDFPVEVIDPIRLAIPTPLDETLKKKAAEVERPYLRLLVRAAERWIATHNTPTDDWVI
jgi:hypothetical protein